MTGLRRGFSRAVGEVAQQSSGYSLHGKSFQSAGAYMTVLELEAVSSRVSVIFSGDPRNTR